MPQLALNGIQKEDLTKDAGRAIRAHRVKLGLTGAAFATLVGVSERTQRSYEAGQRPPDLHYLRAAALQGLDLGLLLAGVASHTLDLASAAARAGTAAAAVTAAIQARGVNCPPETVGRIVEILCRHHWDALANPPISGALVESLVAMAAE